MSDVGARTALRTVGDVVAWLRATAEQAEYDLLGRDPICQVFLRFLGFASVPDQRSPQAPLACYFDGQGLVLCLGEDLRVPAPVSPRGPVISGVGDLAAFGATEVCPGVWALEPSLHMPGLFHAFVVVFDTDSAPWSSS